MTMYRFCKVIEVDGVEREEIAAIKPSHRRHCVVKCDQIKVSNAQKVMATVWVLDGLGCKNHDGTCFESTEKDEHTIGLFCQ